MDTMLELLTMLGPTIVAILTVPLMRGIKFTVTVVDGWPPAVQQIMTVVLAFGLSKLGALTNLVFPEAFHLFGEGDAAALISAGMAFAIHAGEKARSK